MISQQEITTKRRTTLPQTSERRLCGSLSTAYHACLCEISGSSDDLNDRTVGEGNGSRLLHLDLDSPSISTCRALEAREDSLGRMCGQCLQGLKGGWLYRL